MISIGQFFVSAPQLSMNGTIGRLVAHGQEICAQGDETSEGEELLTI